MTVDGSQSVVLPITDKADRKDSSNLTGLASTIEVACHNLGLSVRLREKDPGTGKTCSREKHILTSVTARFRPGHLTAIMGASGAGKTSLLNILSGDLSAKAKSTGEILLNGVPTKASRLKKISGFVYQDDLILSTMTVREAIRMSAVLRLPSRMSLEEKEDRVDAIISLLGLQAARDTVIGSETVKGISGGERKRTSIAMEMVTNPALLFLDEPTSGLDTFTAFQVVSRLKAVALEGRTVVSTIHQPSSEVFYQFDDLLLLAKGRVVYYGPTDEVVAYFGKIGFQCPQYNNPADYVFMNALNRAESLLDGGDDDSGSVEAQIAQLLEHWQGSAEEAQLLNDQVAAAKASGDPDKLNLAMNLVRRSKASPLVQFSFLAARTLRNAIRNFLILRLRIGRAIFMGLLIGSIYWNVPSHEGYAQFQDRVSSITFMLNNEIMSASISTILVFGLEKAIVRREHQAGFYGIGPYYVAKVVTEMPFAIFSPLITIGIAYYMIGLRPGLGHFATALGTGTIMSLVANAIGILIGAIFSPQAAMTSFPMLLLPLMIFGGLMINLKSIPSWYRFMPHISPLKYGFTAMTKNEFEGLVFTNCTPNGLIPCTGEAALQLLGLDKHPAIYTNWAILLLMWAVLVVAGFLAILVSSKRRG